MSLRHDSLLLSSSSSISISKLEIFVIISPMIDAFVMLQAAPAAEGVKRNSRGCC